MLDYSALTRNERTLSELTEGLGREDLARLTNESVDAVLQLMAECRDVDVVFVPSDPDAYDDAAANVDEVHVAWTLAHVVVHITASAEEAAAIAVEMARGVPDRGGRSRYEVPWRSIRTLTQCRKRLEESRHMRLASLEMWPDQPHLDNVYPIWTGEKVNAIARYVTGLWHEASHLNQIADIVHQARMDG
jgi:hypothetical protein